MKCRKQSEEKLRFLLKNYVYDPLTGKIYRLPTYHRTFREVGNRKDRHGYYICAIGRRFGSMLAHRVAFALMTRRFALHPIDHINGVKTDNRWKNLRLAPGSINSTNKLIHRNGKPVGVYFDQRAKRWIATAPKHYLNWKSTKRKHLGRFHSQQEAIDAIFEFCSNPKL